MRDGTLTRRKSLQVFGSLAVGAAIPGCGASNSPRNGMSAGDAGEADARTSGSGMCVLTPEQAQGPYFVDTGLERVDITEGKSGTSLRMRFVVLDAATCAPIEGVAIEVWHADATGAYSGFDRSQGNIADNAGLTFLRGYQRTDSAGEVEFATVYPGWYPGRTPHVHVAGLMDGDRLVTTQCYFDDNLSDRVYASAPYDARGAADTRNDGDGVVRFGGAAALGQLLFEVEERPDGYDARFVIGVDRA